MKLKYILITVCCFFTLAGQADEGMWMLGNLNKQTRKTMKELGLQMSADKLYNPKKPSLKDAVVSFGGFCSGVVVKPGWCLPIIIVVLAVCSNIHRWNMITSRMVLWHVAVKKNSLIRNFMSVFCYAQKM